MELRKRSIVFFLFSLFVFVACGQETAATSSGGLNSPKTSETQSIAKPVQSRVVAETAAR